MCVLAWARVCFAWLIHCNVTTLHYDCVALRQHFDELFWTSCLLGKKMALFILPLKDVARGFSTCALSRNAFFVFHGNVIFLVSSVWFLQKLRRVWWNDEPLIHWLGCWIRRDVWIRYEERKATFLFFSDGVIFVGLCSPISFLSKRHDGFHGAHP